MPPLNCNLSLALWHALQNRHQTTGESIDHIVSQALADHLQVEHGTLFQVSTSGALVEGVYQGEVTISLLREYGDFGLGTFDHLDGEMVVLDGHFYQVRGTGTAHEVADQTLTPFAVITHFVPDQTLEISDCSTLRSLEAAIDAYRSSNNIFFALRIDGEFDYVKCRAACKSEQGVPLVIATQDQAEFEFHHLRGTMVGFWTPEYAKTLNVPGYHLHFLSADRQVGGHVLDCTATKLTVQLQQEGNFRMSLPTNADFLKADLTRDPSQDLMQAEKAHT